MAATMPPLSVGPYFRFDPTTGLRTEGRRTVVVLRGEWDISTQALLADVLSRVIASGDGDVVIDLSEVGFIDTAIVRAFIVGQQLLRRRGRELTLRSPSRVVLRVLEVFGLTDLFEVTTPQTDSASNR